VKRQGKSCLPPPRARRVWREPSLSRLLPRYELRLDLQGLVDPQLCPEPPGWAFLFELDPQGLCSQRLTGSPPWNPMIVVLALGL
jgi:hypothetical protein